MSDGENLAERTRFEKYLHIWREELSVPYFFENNELSSHLKRSPVRLASLIEEISRHGKVSRTHFSPTGFKTDLPYAEVARIYLSMDG
jgi:tRNA (guanine26-N2/guanine27-N2)-dimethyltransferase